MFHRRFLPQGRDRWSVCVLIWIEWRRPALIISRVGSAATTHLIILLARSPRPSKLAGRSSKVGVRDLRHRSSPSFVGWSRLQLAWSPWWRSRRFGWELPLLWRRCLSLYRRILYLITPSSLCSRFAFCCCQVRSPVCQAVQLIHAEARQDGIISLCVLVVDLHHTTNEELLLLCSARLPVVGFCDGDHKSLVPSPLLLLLLVLVPGLHMYKVLHSRQILHGPCLSYREGAVGILSRLVQLDSARVPHGDHDHTALFVRRRRGGRRR